MGGGRHIIEGVLTGNGLNGSILCVCRERKCLSVERKTITGRLKVRIVSAVVLLLGLQVMIRGCSAETVGASGESNTLRSSMLQELAGTAKRSLYETFMPSLSFALESGHETYWLLQEQIESVLPFYGYLTEGLESEDGRTGTAFREISMEASVGSSYPEKQAEDSYFREDQDQHDGDNALEELLRAENEAALQMQQSLQETLQEFVPHVQQAQVDLAAFQDYETLVREFYTIDANTMAGSDQLNVNKLSTKDMSISRDSAGPQILIYHTHSQEGYADSVSGDDSTNIQGVGERLTQILQDTYGYQVLHHTGEYDVKTRDDAYANALPVISQILAENPSIQVVIDLHRDEVPESTRLVVDLDGKPTARFMFFNGLSRTKTTGDIAYLYNEYLEDNLAFSFQMQQKAVEYYPGLTRRIYLKGYRYNMHLASKYLLIELGAQNNTLDEAMNACYPLAHILDMVLSGQ